MWGSVQSGIASRMRSRAPSSTRSWACAACSRGSGVSIAIDNEPSPDAAVRSAAACCMLLGRGRKVVATEQADGHVVEHHGPEREAGAVRPGGVGGDDGLVLGYGGVEVDVVGERDLDDPVNAVGCVCPDGAGRI